MEGREERKSRCYGKKRADVVCRKRCIKATRHRSTACHIENNGYLEAIPAPVLNSKLQF